MKIVRINHKFREFLKEKDKHFQHEGIGVLVKLSGNFYYLPMTNKIDEILPNHHSRYKTEIVMDRKHKPIATIEIRDYYMIDQTLVTFDIEMTPLEKQEVIYIRKNKKTISNKLEKMCMNSKRRHKRVVKIYEEYYEENINIMRLNRSFGTRYFRDAIKSMSIVEGVNITDNHIEKVIQYGDVRVDVPDTLDSFAIKTVINLKYAWDEVISRLNDPITLDYIIEINALIARDEALEINKLRSTPITVSGTHIIDIPDKQKIKIDIQRFLRLNEPHRYEQDILELYIYLITNQLFYDGNKRTAFLIANHILISMGIGILIIQDKNLDEFNTLLDKVYVSNSIENKSTFITFLREYCIIRKN